MERTSTRTGVVNERMKGKSAEENIRGIVARFSKARETAFLTIDDIGTWAFRIREGTGNRCDVVVQDIRNELIRMAQSTSFPDLPLTRVGEQVETIKRELSPEETECTLAIIKIKFEQNMHRHEGVIWRKVEKALRRDTEALWSIDQMEKQGHDPDIYHWDDQGFDIGTCSKEVPKSGRNCVYDAGIARLIKRKHPTREFNGSAVEQARAMGLTVISYDQYVILLTKGIFDRYSNSFLFTSQNSDGILSGSQKEDSTVEAFYIDHCDHHIRKGWRGSRRVLWN